jgi:hypothetical protein
VNGKELTQPLTLRLDPRVQTAAGDLERLADLSRRMYDGAVSAHAAYEQARALVAELDTMKDPDAAAFERQVEALAPAPQERMGGRFFRRAAPSGPPTLNGVSQEMMNAAMAMQDAEVAPTAREVAACEQAGRRSDDVMGRWHTLATTGLAALNAKRRSKGLKPLQLTGRTP